MNPVCPQCAGELVPSGPGTVTCPLHGGEYLAPAASIPVSVPPPPPLPAQQSSFAPLMESEACFKHPDVLATGRCASCGTALCNLCTISDSRGMKYCPTCYSRKLSATAPPPRIPMNRPPRVPLGTKCSAHPEVAAVDRCTRCGAAVCGTCDFVFPGNVHLCPKCVSAPQQMSPGKKKSLIFCYIIAAWTTVASALVFSGLLAHMITSQSDAELLGGCLMIFVMIPSLVGTGLSFGNIDKRGRTSIAAWIVLFWNGAITLAYVLLMIKGSMK